MKTDTCKSKIQINGYFVYTRWKRNHHRDSDNEEPKRLKNDENADVVKNDVVKWTSKRQWRPSFKVKVDSGEDVSAAAKLAAERTKQLVRSGWTWRSFLILIFMMVFLLFMSCFLRSLIFFVGLFLQIPFWVFFLFLRQRRVGRWWLRRCLVAARTITVVSSESNWWLCVCVFPGLMAARNH